MQPLSMRVVCRLRPDLSASDGLSRGYPRSRSVLLPDSGQFTRRRLRPGAPSLAQSLAEPQRAQTHDAHAEGGERQHLRPQHLQSIALQEDAADDGEEEAEEGRALQELRRLLAQVPRRLGHDVIMMLAELDKALALDESMGAAEGRLPWDPNKPSGGNLPPPEEG